MRLLIVFFLFINFLYAKKDFYYSFIDSNGSQISETRKQEISDGFDIVANARAMARDGKIDDAYALIKDFKEKNKLKVLESDLNIVYAELALKKKAKRFILDAAKTLEASINASKINEYDLPQAYMLLVELKLQTNRTKDAKYFAQIIINNFDDELVKTYGKIKLAKVYKYQKLYSKAIKILYEVLAKTNDKHVATVVADELFDVYIADNKLDKANELIAKVLKSNIDYYANDSYLANQKINKLIKAGMPQHAVDILKELLERTEKEESIEDFKYKLANTYMLMYDRTNFYLEKAKELYKDIINDFEKGAYFKKSKMYIDEILMRQGTITPAVIANKYRSSEAMQQKALLQELLNDKADKKYKKIIRSKKIYKGISKSIINRFGFASLDELFDEVNIEMIKQLLNENKCFELNKALQTSRNETLTKLIEDEALKFKFFECLIEVPYERAYLQVKDTFNNSRDANVYLYLERMAYSLNLLDEAIDYSFKVEMVDDKSILSKEFLVRYQVLKAKEDGLSLEKFFSYALRNPQYIEQNVNDPIILDFYYDYYLYLLKKEQKNKANEVLKALYNKQKEINAKIYSPFVETELSKLEKDKSNYQKSIDYLLESLQNTRKIKPNDEVKIYYDILKLYEQIGNNLKKDEYIIKCKEVKDTKDSLYKKMCDEM